MKINTVLFIGVFVVLGFFMGACDSLDDNLNSYAGYSIIIEQYPSSSTLSLTNLSQSYSGNIIFEAKIYDKGGTEQTDISDITWYLSSNIPNDKFSPVYSGSTKRMSLNTSFAVPNDNVWVKAGWASLISSMTVTFTD